MYCDEHKEYNSRIKRLEQNDLNHDALIKEITMKLNLILGGIILSPFLVTVFLLLIKYK